MTPGDLAGSLREAAETMPTAADRLPATLHRAARLRRRRRGLAAAATAAAVTAVVAGSLLVSARSPGEPAPLPAASPPPAGTVPVGTVPVPAARLAGTTLLVSFVGAPDTGPTDPCRHTYVAEATETDRVVTVVVRDHAAAGGVPDGRACTRIGRNRLLPVPLAGPLGSRTVVDGSTGAAVRVVRRLLTMPRPSGWTQRAEYGDKFGWQQSYAGPGGEFLLNQGGRGIGTLAHPGFFQQTGVTTLRGTSAAWGTAPGETSLHWVEGDQGFQLLSSDLDVEQLVRIAAELTG